MKKLHFISGIVLLSILIACSEDESQNNPNNEEEAEQSLLIGDWTAVRIGVVYDDATEESSDDACGGFQNLSFMQDGTFESDNYTYMLVDEVCMFSETWSGTFMEMNSEIFPDANYELVIDLDGDEELIRYPEITFDGEDNMRIQYPWPGGGNISHSFTLYERD